MDTSRPGPHPHSVTEDGVGVGSEEDADAVGQPMWKAVRVGFTVDIVATGWTPS